MNLPTVRCDGGCRGPKNMIFRVLRIAVLVFGVLLDTAVVAATSTTQKPADYCTRIPPGKSVESIIDECAHLTMAVMASQGNNNYVFDISNQTSEEKINNFFQSISAGFHLDFAMENNDFIKTVNFGGAFSFKPLLNFFIKNNKLLETVQFGNLFVKFNGGNIIVRGNRYLTGASIEKLRTMARDGSANADIQDEKECSQSDPLDFSNCERIYGDLVLTDFSQTGSKFHPKAISGCLNLTKTSVDLNVMDFLKDLNFSTLQCPDTNKISGYCIMEKDRKILTGNGIEIENNENCKYDCKQADIFDHLQSNCKVIEGDIAVTNSWTKQQLELLLNVMTVKGSVKIDGVDGSKIGGKLSFFASLENIDSQDPNVPALTIINNIGASEINLNSLKINGIASPASPKLLYKDNSFKCSEKQRSILKNALNEGFVVCGGEEALPSTSNGALNVTEPPTGQLGTDDTSQGNGAKDEGGLSGWSIAWIVIAIIAVIIFIVLVVLLIFCLVKRNKKKHEKLRKKELEKDIELRVAKKVVNEADSHIKEANEEGKKISNPLGELVDQVWDLTYTSESDKKEYKGEEAFQKCYAENDKKDFYQGKDLSSAIYEKNKEDYTEDYKYYDHNHVEVDAVKYKIEGSKTIHASRITFPNNPREFIAIQPPTSRSKVDNLEVFLAMAKEENVRVVISLSMYDEWRNCPYFPLMLEDKIIRGKWTMENISYKKLDFVERREFSASFAVEETKEEKEKWEKEKKKTDEEAKKKEDEMKLSEEERKKNQLERDEEHKAKWAKAMNARLAQNNHIFTHIQVLGWEDNTPTTALYHLFFYLYKLKDLLEMTDDQRLVVHSSGKLNRTGTFMAAMDILRILHEELPKSPSAPKIDYFGYFKDLRRKLVNSFATVDQFYTLPVVVMMYCKTHSTNVEVQQKSKKFIDLYGEAKYVNNTVLTNVLRRMMISGITGYKQTNRNKEILATKNEQEEPKKPREETSSIQKRRELSMKINKKELEEMEREEAKKAAGGSK